jgi:hypothetical protein
MGLCSPLPEDVVSKTAKRIDDAVGRDDLQTAQNIMNDVNNWRTSCNEQKNVFDHLGPSKENGTILYHDTSSYRQFGKEKVQDTDTGYLEFGPLY